MDSPRRRAVLPLTCTAPLALLLHVSIVAALLVPPSRDLSASQTSPRLPGCRVCRAGWRGGGIHGHQTHRPQPPDVRHRPPSLPRLSPVGRRRHRTTTTVRTCHDVAPFDPSIDDAVLEDLRDRLRGTRWPDEVDGAGWDHGMSTPVLRSFVQTWLDDFDWAAQQERLRSFDHVKISVDGLGVHAVHAKGPAGDAMPLLLLHGWPSSFVQMLPIIPLLTAASQPFDVVAMSLPGYGFSDRPTKRGMDVGAIATVTMSVMAQLGYDQFAARGRTSAPECSNSSRWPSPTGSWPCTCPAPTPT